MCPIPFDECITKMIQLPSNKILFVYINITFYMYRQTGHPFLFLICVNHFTDCPFNSIPYNGACYGVYTFTSDDFAGVPMHNSQTQGVQFGVAKEFCENSSPAGNLILPESAAENDFIQKLAKLTE